MAIRGFVDWRGNPIHREVHGGVRAAMFIYCKWLYSYLSWFMCVVILDTCFTDEICINFWTSAPYFNPLTVLTVVTSMVNVPNLLNLVTYLHGTMHMGLSNSATTVTNFVGATSGFALIGAFLSDSYISRSRTILLFGPLEFLVILLFFFFAKW
jgi:hypothetical protein